LKTEQLIGGVQIQPCKKLGHNKQNDILGEDERRMGSDYLTTVEAAAYLRKSPSWLLHQADVPYLSGNPNIYKRKDLDAWFEKHKIHPRVDV
jgi:hypothetical protein